MATNILALPLALLEVETGNNEDWIDSVKYLVGDAPPDEEPPQLDLTGIEFEMEVRRAAGDHEVILSASTKAGGLSIGAPPNTGYLIISIPVTTMKPIRAGEYVADIVATDGTYTRRCIEIALTVKEGLTR